jgi:hypothetical protein
MADFTDTSEAAILDWWGAIGSPSRPTAHWISLFTVIPSADDGTGGTECSNSGYARQSVTWVRSGQTLNPSATVTFGPAGEAWTEVVAFGVHSLVTGGVIYAFKGLTTPRTLGNGDSAEFATSDLSVTLD